MYGNYLRTKYKIYLCDLSGMNQFNQMGMQPMGQRSTPPLPMGASGNQVSTEHTMFLVVWFSLCVSIAAHFVKTATAALQILFAFCLNTSLVRQDYQHECVSFSSSHLKLIFQVFFHCHSNFYTPAVMVT